MMMQFNQKIQSLLHKKTLGLNATDIRQQKINFVNEGKTRQCGNSNRESKPNNSKKISLKKSKILNCQSKLEESNDHYKQLAELMRQKLKICQYQSNNEGNDVKRSINKMIKIKLFSKSCRKFRPSQSGMCHQPDQPSIGFQGSINSKTIFNCETNCQFIDFNDNKEGLARSYSSFYEDQKTVFKNKLFRTSKISIKSGLGSSSKSEDKKIKILVNNRKGSDGKISQRLKMKIKLNNKLNGNQETNQQQYQKQLICHRKGSCSPITQYFESLQKKQINQQITNCNKCYPQTQKQAKALPHDYKLNQQEYPNKQFSNCNCPESNQPHIDQNTNIKIKAKTENKNKKNAEKQKDAKHMENTEETKGQGYAIDSWREILNIKQSNRNVQDSECDQNELFQFVQRTHR